VLADRESSLRPADLERLAIAAFLIGREPEFERVLARAHRAYRDGGDCSRAARRAFWIAARKLETVTFTARVSTP
jgi:hypothetical protein